MSIPDVNLTSKPWSGLLHLHGSDISTLQRIVDPVIILFLYRILLPDSFSLHLLTLPSWSIVLVSFYLLLPSAGLYVSFRSTSLLTLFRKILLRTSLCISTLTCLFLYFLPSQLFPLSSYIYWCMLSLAWLTSTHCFARVILRRLRAYGGNTLSTLFCGTPNSFYGFVAELASSPWMGLRVNAFFNFSPQSVQAAYPSGVQLLASIDELRDYLKSETVDRIYFETESLTSSELSSLITVFGDTSIPTFFLPGWVLPTMNFSLDPVGRKPCVNLWGMPPSAFDLAIKRLADIFVSAFLLFTLLPILLFIALLVRLSSPGPVLFLQTRYGIDGRPFRCFKFRTMFQSAAGLPAIQARHRDPRITYLGHFLRSTSLDELPQLLNVLLGDMSLVGPRPHATEHNEYYRSLIVGYMQRHCCKPGITGLAQVRGLRGETPELGLMSARINTDLYYQKNWSLSMDLKILLKTLFVFAGSNAR
ncbi:exopolysaccharide biosynthesis polyprenyl glycosylphosphotransferase [Synechococcus sp. W4D4]|uniref:exopolysaccharide biosynthesis polyprenyl glycosylphosphotransferase n=1 Tax=Synechococcus sp. W4D4 TaxID=3392294 RepID=UPI0039E89E20